MTQSPSQSSPGSGFRLGEIATLACARCKKEFVPWELRSFGDRAICASCFNATLEVARGAIKVFDDDPGRLCSNCRALRNPSLGSAWCSLIELGDERARICANFVPERVDSARAELTGSRVKLIDAWRGACEELKLALGNDGFKHWFVHVEPLSLEDGVLTLAAADEYTRDWLDQRMQPVIRSALAIAGYPDVVVRVVVDAGAAKDEEPPQSEDFSAARAQAGFNLNYTFAAFVVGAGNRLAHASALACVDKRGTAYNPLVLYGGVGVGKTHLLQAIGQEVIERGGRNVLYTTSESFTNDLIHAIRDGSTAAFRERFRNVDYLLLDDIQFIAGKEATQEEFFHTFNALHQAGKQIVVTSDRSPTELKTLEDRLRSRFAWGLTADMQPPDFETRIAIVRTKAALRHRRVPETVLNALATRASRNVRELEGALNRVIALADLLGTEPGMEIVRSVLGDPDTERGICRPTDVLQAVSAYFRVKATDLAGPQRDRSIAYARQTAMYLLREEAKLSLAEVGNQLGGRNHSTVIYGYDKIAGEVRRKGRVRQDIQAIKQLMYGVA